MSNTIDLKKKFLELFPDNYIRVIPDGMKVYENCGGVGWHNKTPGYISPCQVCKGKGFTGDRLCSCGNKIEHPLHIKCKKCREKEREGKEQECFNKAKKVSFTDYDGLFYSGDYNDHVKDKEDFKEWLYNRIFNGEEVPSWVWATKKTKCFNINIFDIVNDACEDGYEDMYDFLDTEALQPIQNKIDKWMEDQGDYLYYYHPDKSTVVLLDDIVEKLKEEINNKK